jgi:hypothetical protein
MGGSGDIKHSVDTLPLYLVHSLHGDALSTVCGQVSRCVQRCVRQLFAAYATGKIVDGDEAAILLDLL